MIALHLLPFQRQQHSLQELRGESMWMVVTVDSDQVSEAQSCPTYQEVGTHDLQDGCGIISTTILLFFSLRSESRS
jgi:hypothetical protein